MPTQARISFWVSLIRICDGFILISDCDELKPSELFGEHKKNGCSSNPSGNFSKKRRYEQYHLDLGQSDFMLYACSLCGLMYARGVEEDEQIHHKFHQDNERGIRFKGWHNERVVSGSQTNGDRILLILDTDPSTHKRSVVIIGEEKAIPAKCGIMTIWVVPSSRRKKVATQLLDAARKSAHSLHLPQRIGIYFQLYKQQISPYLQSR